MISGARIKERLKVVGISQAELGRRVGLGQSTINGLIHGEQQGSTKLHQIARVLRTTPAYLSLETDDPDGGLADSDLSFEELELLDLWKGMAPKDQAALLQLARTIASSAASPTVQAKRPDYRGE